MSDHRPRDVLIKRINFWWYAITLVPVLALFLAAAYGYLPIFVVLFAIFALIFWLSSLGFAIYAIFRKPKEPRQ